MVEVLRSLLSRILIDLQSNPTPEEQLALTVEYNTTIAVVNALNLQSTVDDLITEIEALIVVANVDT